MVYNIEKIGFIGLGTMGQPMAHNLIKADCSLCVWDIGPQRMEPLVAAGAQAGHSAANVAAQSNIVLICVNNTTNVETVIFGEQGVAVGAKPGTLVIDMSTISAKATREMAARLAAKEIHLLDAPVSGGQEGAEKGLLTIMVGGETEQVERVMPLLQQLGKTITHVGPVGNGQLMKQVNQILVVGNMLVAGEALLFAQEAGLDLEQTLAAVSEGAGGSWMLKYRGPKVLNRDFQPGFTIDLQQKDLRLVLETADQLGVPLLSTSLIHQLYGSLQKRGHGGEASNALVKALENLVGVEIKSDE